VLDKVADGLQASEDNKIPRVQNFPETPSGGIRIDEDGHGRFTLRSLGILGVYRERGAAAGNPTEIGTWGNGINITFLSLAYSAKKRKFGAVE
jgi:hypothetical protein